MRLTLSGPLPNRKARTERPSRDTPMAVPDELDKEHRYKYVWACLSEYRHYRDERYAEEIREFRDRGLVPAWCAAGEI